MLSRLVALSLSLWATCHGRLTPIGDDTIVWPQCLEAVATNRNQTTSRCQTFCAENNKGRLDGFTAVNELESKVPQGCEIPATVSNTYQANGICHSDKRIFRIWFESTLDRAQGYHVRGRLQQADLKVSSDDFSEDNCKAVSAVRYARFERVWPEQVDETEILHNLEPGTEKELTCSLSIDHEDYVQKFDHKLSPPQLKLDATYLLLKEFPQIGYHTFSFLISIQSPSATCVGVIDRVEVTTRHTVRLIGRLKETPAHRARDLS